MLFESEIPNCTLDWKLKSKDCGCKRSEVKDSKVKEASITWIGTICIT